MKSSVYRVATLLAIVGIVLVPMLPPEHVHRGASDDRHTHTLIHRHWAPHATPNGAHVGHPGVAEGAPLWLADPPASALRLVSVVADATRSPWPVGVPASRSTTIVAPPSEPALHGPPRRPFALRGPPHI